VTGLHNGNAFVALDADHSGFLHRSRIGATGIGDAADYLAVGDEVEVVVDEVGPGKDGKVNITCSARTLATPSAEERLQQSFSIGGTYAGTITNVTDFGAFVRLEGGIGTDCLVHRTKIGPGVIHPRRTLSIGDALEVTVLGYTTTPRGPSLEVAASNVAAPALIDQLRELVGETPQATVAQARQNAVSVTLPDGTAARVPSDRLGPDGALDPAFLLTRGETLTVRLLGAEWRDNRVEARAEARDYPTGSLLEQARQVFSASPRVEGEAGRLLPMGRLVRISHRLSALVRFRELDAARRAWLEGLPEGAGVTVEVVEVREGPGPRGLQIDARLV
jgi:ribosomal protein S1